MCVGCPMRFERIAQYATRIETDLRQNILPFWRQHVVDRKQWTFFGSLTNDLVLDQAAIRGALLTTRILWTYSAAYRQYRDKEDRQMADFAYADLLARFLDDRYGGRLWSLSTAGLPRRPQQPT